MPEYMPGNDLVVVTNLRKTYGATVAVEDVSLTVHAGEIFGILGPNGAGKTTTVESKPPYSGRRHGPGGRPGPAQAPHRDHLAGRRPTAGE